MVACTAQLNALAAYYASTGADVALCTGNPGSGTTVSNEATGGSPAYARVAGTWSAGSTGVQNLSNVTINVPSGTYSYVALCSALTGNTMVDNCAASPGVTMVAQGQIVAGLTYTQT